MQSYACINLHVSTLYILLLPTYKCIHIASTHVRIVTENKYANRKLIKKRGGGDNVVSQAHMIKTNACLPQTKVKLIDFAYPL